MKIKMSELSNIIKEEIKLQLKEKRLVKEGKFTNKRLLDLIQKYKAKDLLFFANGREYALYPEDIDSNEDSVFGMEHHGAEKEINTKDIEFITINGKRITESKQIVKEAKEKYEAEADVLQKMIDDLYKQKKLFQRIFIIN